MQSYLSSIDLWRFANEAEESNDSAEVFEGLSAARECSGLIDRQADISAFISGSKATSVRGDLSPEREMAATTVLKRCSGFADAGLARIGALIAALAKREEDLGGEGGCLCKWLF